MADILHEMVVQASPAKIFEALTVQKELASWWTTSARAEPVVGAVEEFNFRGGLYTVTLEVTELVPDQKVSWKIDRGNPEWKDTVVSWQLTPLENGTRVYFGQYGYPSNKNSYASASYNWAWYMSSLKAFVETGVGHPDPTPPQ